MPLPGRATHKVTVVEPLIRELTDADRDANDRLGREAFGYPPGQQPLVLPPDDGAVFGAFVEGELVAKIRSHDYACHVPGGRTIGSCGLESVAVHPESRGRGLLTPLFRAGFERAQRLGQALSVLFPTAAGIYHRFGYAVAGGLEQREIPVSLLAGMKAPEGISLRRATTDDLDHVRDVYGAWAADRLGPLARTGRSAPILGASYVTHPAAVTLACDGTGETVGSVRWTRGTGYDPRTSVIEVQDLIAVTPDAARALWRFLGTFSTVSGRIKVEIPSGDDALVVLPVEPDPPSREHRCMVALLDIPAALGARRGIPGLSTRLSFGVEGGFATGVDGAYTLTVDGTELRCAPAQSSDGPVFSARGIAALYAGSQRCTGLRTTGLLRGSAQHDLVWDALFNTPMQLRDYF